MEKRLTPAQRLQIIQLYYENQRSTRNVYRALRATYGPHNRPTERTIRNTIKKLETQFTLLDDTRPNRPHPARSEQNFAAVAESVRDDPDITVRRRSKQLGLSYGTTWRILKNSQIIQPEEEAQIVDDSEEDDEPKAPAKRGRGRKKGAEQKKEPKGNHGAASNKNKETDEVDSTANGTADLDLLEEDEIKEEPEEGEAESPPPVKKGRARNADAETEVKKPIKTAGAKKLFSGIWTVPQKVRGNGK